MMLAMVDVSTHVEYWRTSALEDLAAARSLLAQRHFRHALFFAHLGLEKVLKAHVTRATGSIAPRTHNLERLGELAGLHLSADRAEWLRSFSIHQLEGRYPDTAQVPLDEHTAVGELAAAEEFASWLTRML